MNDLDPYNIELMIKEILTKCDLFRANPHLYKHTKKMHRENNYTPFQVFLDRYGRELGNHIYDLPTKHSGMVQDCLLDEEEYLPTESQRIALYRHAHPDASLAEAQYNVAICEDHYNPRKTTGEMVYEFAYNNPHLFTVEWLTAVIRECTQVHWITKEANASLSSVQNNNKDKDHTFHYEKKSVTTKQMKGRRDKYVYWYGDQYFPNNDAVFEAFPDVPNVLDRFAGTTKKWIQQGYRRQLYVDYMRDRRG